MRRAAFLFLCFVVSGSIASAANMGFLAAKEQTFPDLEKFSDRSPGIAVLVIKDGQTILKRGYGLADLEKKTPITGDTIFESGSIGKMFTAAAIIKLEQSGKLDTNLPARHYLGNEFPKLPKTIKVKDLIFHTSGIPDYLNDKDLNLNGKVNSGVLIGNEFVSDYVNKKKVDIKQIGKDFSYSNTNYVILSRIIERVSGMKYSEYMKMDVFKPAEMSSFIHEAGLEVLPGESKSYSEWPYFKPLQNKTNYVTTGDFGVRISVNDFEKWIAFLASNPGLWQKYQERGKVLSKKAVKEIDYGYGMRFGKIADFDCIFHRGYINGASNIFVFNKEFNTFIVVLSNTSGVFTDNIAAYILSTIKAEVISSRAVQVS